MEDIIYKDYLWTKRNHFSGYWLENQSAVSVTYSKRDILLDAWGSCEKEFVLSVFRLVIFNS